MTPSRVAAVNSLSAIAAEHGLEGEEDDMWGQIRDWRGDDVSNRPFLSRPYPIHGD